MGHSHCRGLSGTVAAVCLAVVAALASACSAPADDAIPLLAVSGPSDFRSVELRTPKGEVVWRLEARSPADLEYLVYPAVPAGFEQVVPAVGQPRPLSPGEDLTLESRTTRRVFIHRAFARSADTIEIFGSEMRSLARESALTEAAGEAR